MTTEPSQHSLVGLAKRLVANGLLTEQKAIDAFNTAKQHQTPFVSHLVANKILSAKDIAHVGSYDFGVPLLDLEQFNLEYIPPDLISNKIIQEHHVLPIGKREHRLYVAVSDPTDLQPLDTIKFQTGLNTHALLVEEDKLTATIDTYLSEQETVSFKDLTDTDLDELDIHSQEDEDDIPKTTSETDDAPIVRFVHKILLDAINMGASDIHLEPYEKSYRVRFRQDGLLHEIAAPPVHLANRISARIKIMSKLDISERRIPQDGRFKMILSKSRSIDFRISTCPTLHGEKIVLRILDPTSAKMGIESLGFETAQSEMYTRALTKPQGMILVTGPTGSGKTVTLYTALNILNTSDKNISTVEDPVEINLTGINQVHVNTKTGMTFAVAMRAFLRQDPDVMMVGEIRDLETAEIAVKAAQTGHLVLSTLHTNSAPETLTRLANMGVPPYNIASSVQLIMAQRLARKLCKHCCIEEKIPHESLLAQGFSEAELEKLVVYAPNRKGCDACTSGYKGRVGVYEMMEISTELGKIIMEDGNSLELAEQAQKEGLQSLRRSGLNKVAQGITSLEEINRITKA